MAIVKRLEKGRPLTHKELDNNFDEVVKMSQNKIIEYKIDEPDLKTIEEIRDYINNVSVERNKFTKGDGEINVIVSGEQRFLFKGSNGTYGVDNKQITVSDLMPLSSGDKKRELKLINITDGEYIVQPEDFTDYVLVPSFTNLEDEGDYDYSQIFRVVFNQDSVDSLLEMISVDGQIDVDPWSVYTKRIHYDYEVILSNSIHPTQVEFIGEENPITPGVHLFPTPNHTLKTSKSSYSYNGLYSLKLLMGYKQPFDTEGNYGINAYVTVEGNLEPIVLNRDEREIKTILDQTSYTLTEEDFLTKELVFKSSNSYEPLEVNISVDINNYPHTDTLHEDYVNREARRSAYLSSFDDVTLIFNNGNSNAIEAPKGFKKKSLGKSSSVELWLDYVGGHDTSQFFYFAIEGSLEPEHTYEDIINEVDDKIIETTKDFIPETTIDGKISDATQSFISETIIDSKINEATDGLASETFVNTRITEATSEFLSGTQITNQINLATEDLITKNEVTIQIDESTKDFITETAIDTKINEAITGFIDETTIDGKINDATTGLSSETYVNEQISEALMGISPDREIKVVSGQGEIYYDVVEEDFLTKEVIFKSDDGLPFNVTVNIHYSSYPNHESFQDYINEGLEVPVNEEFKHKSYFSVHGDGVIYFQSGYDSGVHSPVGFKNKTLGESSSAIVTLGIVELSNTDIIANYQLEGTLEPEHTYEDIINEVDDKITDATQNFIDETTIDNKIEDAISDLAHEREIKVINATGEDFIYSIIAEDFDKELIFKSDDELPKEIYVDVESYPDVDFDSGITPETRKNVLLSTYDDITLVFGNRGGNIIEPPKGFKAKTLGKSSSVILSLDYKGRTGVTYTMYYYSLQGSLEPENTYEDIIDEVDVRITDATQNFIDETTIDTKINQATNILPSKTYVNLQITNAITDFVTGNEVSLQIDEATENFITNTQVTTQINEAITGFITETTIDDKIEDAISDLAHEREIKVINVTEEDFEYLIIAEDFDKELIFKSDDGSPKVVDISFTYNGYPDVDFDSGITPETRKDILFSSYDDITLNFINRLGSLIEPPKGFKAKTLGKSSSAILSLDYRTSYHNTSFTYYFSLQGSLEPENTYEDIIDEVDNKLVGISPDREIKVITGQGLIHYDVEQEDFLTKEVVFKSEDGLPFEVNVNVQVSSYPNYESFYDYVNQGIEVPVNNEFRRKAYFSSHGDGTINFLSGYGREVNPPKGYKSKTLGESSSAIITLDVVELDDTDIFVNYALEGTLEPEYPEISGNFISTDGKEITIENGFVTTVTSFTKTRNGTELDLGYTIGLNYNYDGVSINSETYTFTNPVENGYVKCLVNAAVEPVVVGATKISGQDFIPDTNMEMVVESVDGNNARYFFLSL